MDYATKSRKELLQLCKEKGIKSYSTRKKEELITLLSSEPPPPFIPETPSANQTNLELCQQALKQYSISQVSKELNLCVGTVRRWLELKDVPPQYTFDLKKLLNQPIDYSKFSSTEKDQFFTPKTIAETCWNTFRTKVPLTLSDYTFIEPSAGDGSFLSILPKGSIGLDIEPRREGIQTQDYLLWKPADLTKKYIVFGNPPFGLRGHLALKFLNHSHAFADYVCFILPQLFESDGKGSPRKRVKGYNLIYSESLSGMFYTPEKTDVLIHGVFQIWSKHTTNPTYSLKKADETRVKVYSLSDGGTVATTRNKAMIGKCDAYLPSTCFGKEKMRVYSSFQELPGQKGYGIVFLKDKEALLAKTKTIQWADVSFLSTNSAYNLRSSMILAQFA
jgi:hypothetical protein